MISGWKPWAAAWAAAFVLGGCGGGGSSSATPTPTPAPTPAPTATTSSVGLLAATSTDAVGGGAAAQFTVTISNSGAAAATGLFFAPNLAAGLTLTNIICTGAGGATCPTGTFSSANLPLPDMPAKGSLTLQVNVMVAAGASGTLTSMPAVQAGNDAVTTDNTAPAALKVYTADVSISGSGPTAPVAAGSTTAYTMTVSNAGPDDARDVVITNTLGSFQTLGGLTCSASGGATCPTADATMRVPLLPKNGSLVFTVPATVMAGVSGSIANVMTVASAGDPVATNNAAAVQLSAYVPAPVVQAGQSVVTLQSDAGDFIGAGRNYTYTRSTSNLTVTANGGRLTVQVAGDQNWQADFQQPLGLDTVQVGTYSGLKRYPFHNPTAGGLSWGGEGRGCNTLTGSFTVNSVTYVAGQLSAVDLSFEQHCEGAAAALRGQVRWYAGDTTTLPGPVNPPPASAWAPAAGATPATGNYVYLTSDTGDYIGAGRTSTFTQADAVLSVTAVGGRASVSVAGNQNWGGNFQAMQGVSTLQPGYYGNLQRYPFNNPVKGGLDWSGEGRGCNTLTGWFIVDKATYVDGSLTALDLRFEQHCEGGTPALRGKVHWVASDTTAPAGPVNPPPAGLWAPAAGATPATGSYVYLTSDTNDYIGAGRTYTYTAANAVLGVSVDGRKLTVSVTGDQGWSGDFQGMNSITDLQPGYYGNLQRYPFNNATKGGLNWSGEGRGCNTLSGWFVIDSISFVSGRLAALDLRFEQHCEGGSTALRGKIHWDANDATAPPGPLTPPPAGLWSPAVGATPATGSYVYLTSDANDYIGAGRTYTYTRSNAVLAVTGNGRRISVSVNGDQYWTGDFQGMNGLAELRPGYYGDLQRYPFNNPVKGGMSWSGESRGCNTLTGWFVIDSVSFVDSQLAAVDLRFEQHCEGGSAALRGKIHWVP